MEWNDEREWRRNNIIRIRGWDRRNGWRRNRMEMRRNNDNRLME